MAKAKILADRISITSDVLTDENIEKVKILAPSKLVLFDGEEKEERLYEITNSDYNTFTIYGASFKEGKTLGVVPEKYLDLDKEEKEAKTKTLLTAVLTRLNAIEDQVSDYLDEADDLSDDVEFLD